MKHTTLFLGATALLVGAALFLPKTVLAYRGDTSVKGPNYTIEHHDAMTEAFAKKDYTAWKALVGERGVARKINAGNFAKFVEAHNLALQGKTDAATKIRTELGLGLRNGSGMGSGQGMGRQN